MNSTPSSRQFTWTFSTLGCPELTLDQALALARDNGLDAIELRSVEKRVDLPALFTERYGTPAALAKRVAQTGVRVVSLDASLKLFDAPDDARRDLLDFIPWAEALSVPYMRVFDGGNPNDQPTDEDLRRVADTIGWWRSERAKRGCKVDIMIETHDCLVHSDDVERLEALLDEPVAILWDTHHTWRKGGEDVRATWERIGKWAPHLHIKDSKSVPSARHPFTYTPLGDGEFPFADTVNMLEDSGFKGVLSIEWERMWHPYLEPLANILRSAREDGLW